MIYKILNPDLTTQDITEYEFKIASVNQVKLYGVSDCMLLTDASGSPIGYVLLMTTHIRRTVINQPLDILSIHYLKEQK